MLSSLAYYTTVLKKDFSDFCTQRLNELELSQGLLFFILYIGKHSPCSPKELTQSLHMDTGHATRSLAKLEQIGFISQEKNPHDKRARIVKLTKKGEKAFEESHHLFVEWDQTIMSDLSKQEQDTLISLLEKLTHHKGSACYGKKND